MHIGGYGGVFLLIIDCRRTDSGKSTFLKRMDWWKTARRRGMRVGMLAIRKVKHEDSVRLAKWTVDRQSLHKHKLSVISCMFKKLSTSL